MPRAPPAPRLTATEEGWIVSDDSSTSRFNITQYDNDFGVVIAQNDSANAWNADLWSRFDWTRDTDGKLYFCQTANLETSESAAMAVTPADGENLEDGCPGFGWLGLNPS